MNWILRILWLIVGQRAKLMAVHEAKRYGVRAYLRVLQTSRHILIAGLLLFFALQIVLFAGIGTVITGLWLWESDVHFKMQVAFGLCLILFLIPTALLCLALSERLWYRNSGAEKMVNDLIQNK